MRMRVIKDDNLQSLKDTLLDAKLSSDEADAAMQSLQALNPHLDMKKLTPGAILLIPDEPGFKAEAASAVAGDPIDELQQLVRSALDSAAAKLKQGNEARAAQRLEVTAAFKTTAVKRVIESDPDLKQQAEDAAKASKADEEQSLKALQTLQSAGKDMQAELAALAKLLA